MAGQKIQTTVRFDPTLLYKISEVARYNHRSLNAQMEQLAQECVEEFEKKRGEIPVTDAERYRV